MIEEQNKIEKIENSNFKNKQDKKNDFFCCFFAASEN